MNRTIAISDNILLAPISLSDVGDIFNTINCQREYLGQWLPFVDTTKQESDTYSFVQKTVENNGETYTIQEDGKFIGLIAFKDVDTMNNKAEIGYWLSEYAQGRGIMMRSVKALLQFGFENLGLNRVIIKCAMDNQKSRNIPQKLGFKLESVERDGELYGENLYWDLAVYVLLKKEFEV